MRKEDFLNYYNTTSIMEESNKEKSTNEKP